MMQWIKQLFCHHAFRSSTLSVRYGEDGKRYKIYKKVCVRCGKVIYEEVLL